MSYNQDANGRPIPHPAVLRAGVATGAAVTTSGTSINAAIPVNAAGAAPNAVRLSATAACYARLGVLASDASAVVSAAGTGYVPADTITLTGGTFITAAVLTVATVKIISAALNAAGTGYVPGDTITLAGGTAATPGVFTVTHTQAVSATVAAGGTGGTAGTQTVTGTTGTGTKFQASVTVSGGGAITAVLSISVAGDYTVNPTDITQEPVTGASLTGAKLSVVMGVLTKSVTTAGSYSAVPASFTQASTSGSGTGAVFDTLVFGVNTATVTTPGDYSIEPSNPVAQGSTTGGGSGATFTLTWSGTPLVAVAGDMLIQPGDSVVLDATGYSHFAAIQVTTGGKLVCSPIEG